MKRAAKEGLAPVQPESAAPAAQPAAPQVDRLAIGEETARSVIANAEDASRYCPVCSQRLESRHCKLMCPVCGYYMSCADYY